METMRCALYRTADMAAGARLRSVADIAAPAPKSAFWFPVPAFALAGGTDAHTGARQLTETPT